MYLEGQKKGGYTFANVASFFFELLFDVTRFGQL